MKLITIITINIQIIKMLIVMSHNISFFFRGEGSEYSKIFHGAFLKPFFQKNPWGILLP